MVHLFRIPELICKDTAPERGAKPAAPPAPNAAKLGTV